MNSNLIKMVEVAVEIKPKFGDTCNHCGYCCLTEVCQVGQELTGKTIGPCKLLIGEEPNQKHYDPNKHYCSAALYIPEMKEAIGAGEGCCSETQREVITRLT
jgi:uncharacterized cysteine cluster protein YcgN (CxxCxxCC family)